MTATRRPTIIITKRHMMPLVVLFTVLLVSVMSGRVSVRCETSDSTAWPTSVVM